MTVLNIYTDGACSGNQSRENLGGWGAILEYGAHQKELYGGERNTTNNRMEMTALIRALEALKREVAEIRVFSDSAYLMDCFRQKWYVNWKNNQWKTSGKKDVENRDLWEKLLALVEGRPIRFFRVKGHVNLDSEKTDIAGLYETFTKWNGNVFSLEDFLYVTKMNHRADALANRWMDENR